MDAPEGWRWVEVEPGTGFAVPPDAERGGGRPIDSAVGVLVGEGYRITFDLGRFGERLDELAHEAGFRSASRRVAGRSAREVAFRPEDEPFAWARVLQVGAGAGRTLTLRVSCDSVERCSLADDVFASVALG